jgi:MGT family glycosyltransferase
MRRENTLTLCPQSFEGPEAAEEASGTLHVLRFRAVRAPAAPLPDWWPGRSEPFVYVTLGTVIGTMADLSAAYRIALDAVADLPLRVLLTTGAELSPESLGTIPANVHIERFVPQDQVLPHAAALLCHGGSGTTLGALAAGVPMVVAPMFADQPFNAQCIAASGAGLALPTRTATAPEMRSALMRVLEEPSFRAKAQKFAGEIAALPTIDEAGTELARLAGASA